MMASVKRKRFVSHTIVVLVLALGSITTIVPLLWMVITSFDWSARLNITFPPRFWPEDPSFDTYRVAFSNVPMLRYIGNSLVISAGVIAISSCSALLSGYALSKLRFKGSSIVLMAALSTMMVPFEMTMIPQYIIIYKLHLVDSYWAIYLPAINYAFGTFLVKSFMDQLPSDFREAGIMDGANEFTVFWRIFLPLCHPIAATMVILIFLHVWNDLLWPLLVLKDMSKFTIQLGLALFSFKDGINPMPAIIMAGTTVSIVPVVAVYLFLQKYIIASIAMTGVKQ
ncbi:carbohydrate ABC transporter permease [Paenibacillus cymbidii]|uniref:carbohydrate ABC transporter permease n=1 Tax=Paenibacillus cymbidii TaxID=1639034 RepID=UPI001080A8C4|nr:carbohydrate ABC transporter permease [Paenibacillus cymbidii]